MGLFDIFKTKRPDSKIPSQQAVIVELSEAVPRAEIYENYDLSTLEEQIISSLAGTGLGELDGNEVGPREATLFLYGPDADKLFQRIEGILKAYPLFESTQVTIRYGEPGAAQRRVRV
jgi:hypothetical protein